MTLFGALAITLQSVQAVPVPTRSVTAAGHSSQAALSADGEWVVFCSTAPDLVADDTDGAADIFLRSRKSGTTVRISDNSPTTVQHPAISGDGRWITFWEGLADSPEVQDKDLKWRLFVHDRLEQKTEFLRGDDETWTSLRLPGPASLSFDGARIGYVATLRREKQAGVVTTIRRVDQAMVFDRKSGKFECVSVSATGKKASRPVREISLSASGRFAAFCTDDCTLAVPKNAAHSLFEYMDDREHVFLRDLERGETQYASDRALHALGYAGYGEAKVSDDGRFVAYEHFDSRRMGSPHVAFISDLVENRAGRLIEVNDSRTDWFQGRLSVLWMSRDGAAAIVSSAIQGLDPAYSLVRGDQYYSWSRDSGSFRRIGFEALLAAGDDRYPFIAFSEDGKTAAIASARSTLVPGDLNEDLDVFTVSLVDGTVELISVAARP